MVDGSLIAKLLPAWLIIKNFVDGDPNCNYEKYLVEFLNNSAWFRNKVKDELFVWREKQDHGECDTFAGEYELDFKLLVSATYCQAKRELSAGIAVLPQGGIITFSPRRAKPMDATMIYAAFRNLSESDLLKYENGNFKYGTVEHDVWNVISTFTVPKNILFFFPYDFSSNKSCDLEYMIRTIQSALEQDFLTLMKLRSDRYPDKETYLSCICSDVMLFFQFVNSKLNYIDCVNTDKSEIYTKSCWNYI